MADRSLLSDVGVQSFIWHATGIYTDDDEM